MKQGPLSSPLAGRLVAPPLTEAPGGGEEQKLNPSSFQPQPGLRFTENALKQRA